VNSKELLQGTFVKGILIKTKTNNPTKNTWNQIVLVKKRGFGLIYVNGDLRSKEKLNLKNMDMYHNLFIGTYMGNNPHASALTDNKYNHSFNGIIDDIAIYNRALSDKEILQLSEDK